MTHDHDHHNHDDHDEHDHDEHDHHHHHHLHLAPGEFASAKPILNVKNVPASLVYYTEVLGFDLAFAWGDDVQFDRPAAPTFAEVCRGPAAIMLAQGTQGSGETWIYVDVQTRAELDQLHADYARRGARIAAAPEDKPWNRREMLVQDLDGHTLRLGAPVGVPVGPA